jgi:hypothetical protein
LKNISVNNTANTKPLPGSNLAPDVPRQEPSLETNSPHLLCPAAHNANA